MKRSQLRRDDVLIAIVGATIGAAGLYESDGPANINQAIAAVRFPTNRVLPRFVVAYLHTPSGQGTLDYLKRPVARANINLEEIGEIVIPVPPLPKQRELLAKFNAARVARRQKLTQADSLLAGLDGFVLDALGLTLPAPDGRTVYAVRLRDGLRERADANYHTPRFRDIQRRLQACGAVPLGTLCRLSEERADPTVGDGPTFRYIEISSVNSETGEAQPVDTLRSEAPSRARMVARNGNIIVSLTRPQRGSIALIDESLDGCIASTGFAVLTDIDTDNIQTSYLWSYLRTQAARLQMLQRSSGGNYPAITEDELRRVLVPVPNAKVQEKIATEVARRRDEARRLRGEARTIWDDTKRRFEEELLGPETNAEEPKTGRVKRGRKP